MSKFISSEIIEDVICYSIDSTNERLALITSDKPKTCKLIDSSEIKEEKTNHTEIKFDIPLIFKIKFSKNGKMIAALSKYKI